MAKLKFGDTSSCPAMYSSGGSGGSSEEFGKMLNGTLTTLNVPSNITSIKPYAFYKDNALTSANLGNVTNIGAHAFEDTSLASVTMNNVTTLNESAFANTSLTSITIPSGVTNTSNATFKNCSSLATVELSNVTTIGQEAFSGTALTTVNISNSVTTIGQNAFGNCSSLTAINIDQNTGDITGAPWGAYGATVTWKDSGGGDEGEDIDTTLGTRIDNKATVVGVTTDENGKRYALCVVDAAYRSGSAMAWSTGSVDTPLQNNADSTAALADHHTGKYNTDLILSTYTATDYPAFNFARNACTVTIGNNTYYSVLPSFIELQMLYNNKDVLDQYDPTVSTYTERTMRGFLCGGSIGLWSSTERNSNGAWKINDSGSVNYVVKNYDNNYGVCPVIEIPLN